MHVTVSKAIAFSCMPLCPHFPSPNKQHPPKTPQIFKEQANITYFTKLYMTLHPINIILLAEKTSPLKGGRDA